VQKGDKPVLGEPRAGIAGELVKNGRVAALHEHAGQCLLEMAAARDGEQMLLALGIGDIDEVARCETGRLGQHRAGDRDLVVVGELPDDVDRPVLGRRQALAQFDQRPILHPPDEPADHAVEDRNLLLRQPVTRCEKQVGDAAQSPEALFIGAVLNGSFQISDQ
jgi:hypothetical protein